MSLYHATTKNKFVTSVVATLQRHLDWCLRNGAVLWVSDVCLETRDNKEVIVYHYRMPDDTMYTAQLNPYDIEIVDEAAGLLRVLNEDTYLIRR